MKLKFAMLFVTIALLISTVTLSMAMPAPAGDLEVSQNSFKRSLCNTFGACGAKRSLSGATSGFAGLLTNEGGSADSRPSIKATETTKRDLKASLVSEVLSDLVEYLQMNENYRQGKYVIVVPRQTDPYPTGSSQDAAGGRQDPEMQELPLSRIFLNKNE